MRVLLIATNRHDRLMSRLNAKPLPSKQGERWETHFSSVGSVSATFA